MSSNTNMIEKIDQKLDLMTHTVGVTLTAEETAFLRESLKNLGMPKATLTPVSDGDTLTANNELVLEKQSNPGFCYVCLVRCLPSYETTEHNHFRESLQVFVDVLGAEPSGKDVILWLCLLEHVLNGSAESSTMMVDSKNPLPFLNVDAHLKTLAKISTSSYRFQYHDDCGRLHILGSPDDKCGCNEILCDHGWASRFVLQIITREGQTVGADIDFSELFCGEISKPEPSELSLRTQEQANKRTQQMLNRSDSVHEPLRAGVNDPHEEAMREQLSNDMIKLLEQQLNARTESLQLTVEALMQERNQSQSKRAKEDILSSDCFETDTEDENSTVRTLGPTDSSSVLERYHANKRYMKAGSVTGLNMSKPKQVYTMKRTTSVLEPVQEIEDLNREFDVVQGYIKTQSMREKERESLSKVYAINGLAAPFKDKDLNFLIHFHTALETCGMNPSEKPIDAFEYLGTLKPRNPTEELMKQVICRTFDFDDMTVISNPFKLPFINVGMNITESVLCKCMSLMKSKYRNAWFDQMKCLRVPKFHNEFDDYSNDIVHRDSISQSRSSQQRRRSRRDTTGSGSESTTGSSKASSQKKKSNSILGLRI
ncbi:NS1 [Coniothyrium diplodiella negative-stranded RNA virus 1]|uniref:NS1 n=1 Tax=Coniothyrium diplodiella negative-stranded RNA virus 1 TaxID=2587545 RepID=A0A5P8I0C9_9VIRU|nr:NS1 [Coniothyrium diplodiella negative-stranded RNA virus 1]QFQ60953.1 NS1 [Coniothyrium diplodiella negative-stranded RNA virus 1]